MEWTNNNEMPLRKHLYYLYPVFDCKCVLLPSRERKDFLYSTPRALKWLFLPEGADHFEAIFDGYHESFSNNLFYGETIWRIFVFHKMCLSLYHFSDLILPEK